MKIGAIVRVDKNTNINDKFEALCSMGIDNCQMVCWDRSVINSDNWAEIINEAVEKHQITITALWCGWGGPRVWNFYEGQELLGLVPEAFRFQRLEMLMEGSDFAQKIHVADLVTHVGFMPEDPHDPRYLGVITVLKELAKKCKMNNQRFLFETGQETPITLKRAIQDIGYDNVGINLDPANLIMYGKANPVDALEVFGEYVMGVHGKDGCYPTDGYKLGLEKPLGQGMVNYPALIAKLKELGYDESITIEREIIGDDQKKDILMAKRILEELLDK